MYVTKPLINLFKKKRENYIWKKKWGQLEKKQTQNGALLSHTENCIHFSSNIETCELFEKLCYLEKQPVNKKKIKIIHSFY